MPDRMCGAVRRWLIGRDPDTPSLTPHEVVRHTETCRPCQGALALLIAAQASEPPPAIGCGACLGRLDAFSDCERQHGIVAAIERYPAVWWHLWTCGACAEVYHLTGALIEAEERAVLPPIAAALPASRRQPQISIEIPVSRQYLRRVVVPHVALGPAWNDDDDPMLVAEELVQEYRIALYIRPSGGERWSLALTVIPPLVGKVLIRLGDERFQARFDQDGEAHVDDVPVALLMKARGPDMQIAITGDDEEA